jgi:hypothetical protein
MKVKNRFVKKVAIGLVVIMIAGALLSGIAGITGAGKDQPGESQGDLTSTDGVLSKDVYTFVCEIPKQQRPELIYFACADGNNGVGKIEWTTWEATGARGVGEYFANNCEPDCASGAFEFARVNVAIDRPIDVDGKVHLTDLTYESVESGGVSGAINLAEFYLMMNQNK